MKRAFICLFMISSFSALAKAEVMVAEFGACDNEGRSASVCAYTPGEKLLLDHNFSNREARNKIVKAYQEARELGLVRTFPFQLNGRRLEGSSYGLRVLIVDSLIENSDERPRNF